MATFLGGKKHDTYQLYDNHTGRSCRLGFARAPEFGIGTLQEPKQKAPGQKRERQQASIATSASIAQTTAGVPGMPHSCAVLAAFREDGNGAWTGKEAVDDGAFGDEIVSLNAVTDGQEQRTAQIG